MRIPCQGRTRRYFYWPEGRPIMTWRMIHLLYINEDLYKKEGKHRTRTQFGFSCSAQEERMVKTGTPLLL